MYRGIENTIKVIVDGFKKFIKGTDESDKKDDFIIGEKSKYYRINGVHVIETAPKNVYISKLHSTLRKFGIYGINGTWQDNKNAMDIKSVWGLAANEGKPIGPNSNINSPQGCKRGTIIFYKDSIIEVKRINNVNEITKPFEWAIGGGMLLPSYDPEMEGFIGKFSDVLGKTNHTGMGYKNNKIYLFAKERCTMKEFLHSIKLLELQGAIFLDGGGSTQLYYKGNKGISSSRVLSHGVFIKEV